MPKSGEKENNIKENQKIEKISSKEKKSKKETNEKVKNVTKKGNKEEIKKVSKEKSEKDSKLKSASKEKSKNSKKQAIAPKTDRVEVELVQDTEKKAPLENNQLSSIENQSDQKNEEIKTSSLLESKILGTKKKQNDKKREFQTLEVIVLVLLTCIISLAIGGLLGIKFKENNFNSRIKYAGKELQDFIEDYNYLIDHYYGDVDKKELLNTAFKSMVDSLGDSYSGSLGETSNNFDIELKGDYEGLGVEITNDENNNIFVYSIIPNSPASKADLQAGDQLISANGIEISGMTTTDFINQIIKGSGATEFTITVKRDGKNHTIVLKKEAITLQSVTSKLFYEKNKRIGYIKVNIFAENTYDQFKTELENLEKKGMKTLIIDLRDNSGGHLTTVESMISLFLDSSHVIYQTETKTERKKVYSTGNETKNYPIVVIGNTSSASASEVMIGALTEEYGAVFIGTQTFGKGTVQELHELSNGDEYKFTTKKWLTPKGVWVHNNGIQPKFEVLLSDEYYKNPTEENDNQLQRAIQYLERFQ